MSSARPIAGNTPAAAGRTGVPGRPGPLRTEHPRGGGEDPRRRCRSTGDVGTPPRRRGGLLGPRQNSSGFRNTPAAAGRTRATALIARSAAEHPRGGGEDHGPTSNRPENRGTPPRRRGGPMRDTTDRPDRRNTPAAAGRTWPSSRRRGARTEHPRGGGEDFAMCPLLRTTTGTPPRRRGGPPLALHRRQGPRNTPAAAGRTPRSLASCWRPAEHPRGGGEDDSGTRRPRGRIGTPPRRRGGRDVAARRAHRVRNTPAAAGRTTPGQGSSTPLAEHPRGGGEDGVRTGGVPPLPGTPPRRRGGPELFRAGYVADRNTPAAAGRTLTQSTSTSARTEHPRGGGEDDLPVRIKAALAGTPPRRRGGRVRGARPEGV